MFTDLAQFENEVVQNPALIAPGDPSNSLFYERLLADSPNFMPPAWASPPGPYPLLDGITVSAAEIELWILNLEAVAEPTTDAGNAGTEDAGNVPAPEPTDGGVIHASLSNQEVYERMRPDCTTCHMHTGSGSMGFFASFEAFEEKLLANGELVVPGNAQGSELYHRLMGTQGYPPMPQSGAYANLEGAQLSMEEVVAWIENLELPNEPAPPDAGPAASPSDGGSPSTGSSDGGVAVGSDLAVDADRSEVYLVTNADEGYEVEADGEMGHEIAVTVVGQSGGQTAGGTGQTGSASPIAGAQVRISVFGGGVTIENCTTANPGLTDAQGAITCRLTSTRTGSVYADVWAKNVENQGWVQLYDNFEAYICPLSRCPNVLHARSDGPGLYQVHGLPQRIRTRS